MLIIEMTSGSDKLEFDTRQSIPVYINEHQFIVVRIAKLINKSNFNILVNDSKIFIEKVSIIYKS